MVVAASCYMATLLVRNGNMNSYKYLILEQNFKQASIKFQVTSIAMTQSMHPNQQSNGLTKGRPVFLNV